MSEAKAVRLSWSFVRTTIPRPLRGKRTRQCGRRELRLLDSPRQSLRADHQQDPLQPRGKPGQRELPAGPAELSLRLKQTAQPAHVHEPHLAEVKLHLSIPL